MPPLKGSIICLSSSVDIERKDLAVNCFGSPVIKNTPSGFRPVADVQKRGRWKSHRSLTRYEKHARLGHTMLSYTAEPQAHFIDCEAHIADIVLGRKHPVVANIRG